MRLVAPRKGGEEAGWRRQGCHEAPHPCYHLAVFNSPWLQPALELLLCVLQGDAQRDLQSLASQVVSHGIRLPWHVHKLHPPHATPSSLQVPNGCHRGFVHRPSPTWSCTTLHGVNHQPAVPLHRDLNGPRPQRCPPWLQPHLSRSRGSHLALLAPASAEVGTHQTLEAPEPHQQPRILGPGAREAVSGGGPGEQESTADCHKLPVGIDGRPAAPPAGSPHTPIKL